MCKSPTHARYRNAIEGLYIQTHLAQAALTLALDKARAENPENPGEAIARNDTLLGSAIERIKFGQSELSEALLALNHHFDRGCGNVPERILDEGYRP